MAASLGLPVVFTPANPNVRVPTGYLVLTFPADQFNGQVIGFDLPDNALTVVARASGGQRCFMAFSDIVSSTTYLAREDEEIGCFQKQRVFVYVRTPCLVALRIGLIA